MFAVDETVVVGELDERLRPYFFDRADFGDDLFHRLHLVTRRQENRAGAELAPVRTAAARLHGEPVVFVRVKQIKTRHRRVGQVEFAVRDVKRFQLAALKIGEQFRPQQFAFANDHAVAMLPGLIPQRGRGDAAHHHGDFLGTVIIRHLARLVELRGEGADRDEIEIRRQLGQGFQVGDFVIADFKPVRRQPGEREQAEAGQ